MNTETSHESSRLSHSALDSFIGIIDPLDDGLLVHLENIVRHRYQHYTETCAFSLGVFMQGIKKGLLHFSCPVGETVAEQVFHMVTDLNNDLATTDPNEQDCYPYTPAALRAYVTPTPVAEEIWERTMENKDWEIIEQALLAGRDPIGNAGDLTGSGLLDIPFIIELLATKRPIKLSELPLGKHYTEPSVEEDREAARLGFALFYTYVLGG